MTERGDAIQYRLALRRGFDSLQINASVSQRDAVKILVAITRLEGNMRRQARDSIMGSEALSFIGRRKACPLCGESPHDPDRWTTEG